MLGDKDPIEKEPAAKMPAEAIGRGMKRRGFEKCVSCFRGTVVLMSLTLRGLSTGLVYFG